MVNTICFFQTFLVLSLILFAEQVGWAEENYKESDEENSLQSTVLAPPNTRALNSAIGGAYFVDEELWTRHEALKSRLVQIQKDISLGNATSRLALDTLDAIQSESKLLQKELEQKKVLVSAFQVFTKTSEQVFELGEDRLVIVTGDDITVRGWEGPSIKCVVEKTIIAKQQPADSQFDAIKIKHDLAVRPDWVGLTSAEREQAEQKFLKTEAGQKLTAKQRAARQELVDEIHHSYDIYQDFQGRKVNTIELIGLHYQEGNRSLGMIIKSPAGGALHTSQWQRRVKATVYLPTCKSLTLRGCQVGVDVRDIACDLVLSTNGSRDRNYTGAFVVDGVQGDVTIAQVPVRRLSNVTGSVHFQATKEFVNSGTNHEGGTRTFSTFGTAQTQIDHIGGNIEAKFLRTDLRLSAIQGKLDIINRFGSTHLTLDTVDKNRAHRIISESGLIQVDGSAEILNATPFYAYTECGRVRVSSSQSTLESKSFSTGQPRRGWSGFVTPSQEQFDFSMFERPTDALENRDRTAGLDLISHAGMVSILITKSETDAGKHEE